MFQNPDTEIQYRKGGKIMKKTPRKFQAGGATPAPTPSTDRVPPAEAAKMKAEKEQQRREAATQKKGAEKPDLGKLGFKKGGKVKKFSDGGETQADDKDIFYTGRFKGEDGDDIYRRAYEQAGRLREPSGAEVKEVKARTGLTEPSVRKPAPKASAPKASAPKASAPKTAPKAAPKVGPKQESSGTEPKKSYGERGNMARSMDTPSAPDVTQRIKNTLAKARSGSEDTDSRSVNEKIRGLFGRRSGATGDFGSSGASGDYKKGGKVAKYAKGGGIESKGKTAGKIVKMAKGGSVRGYGISKVTNKTKYC
jgi:hypothetical protein